MDKSPPHGGVFLQYFLGKGTRCIAGVLAILLLIYQPSGFVMTNTDAWNLIEQWARKNMPQKSPDSANGPDLAKILTGAGAKSGEFSEFIKPRRAGKK